MLEKKFYLFILIVSCALKTYGLGPMLCNPALPELRVAAKDGERQRRVFLQANPPLTINDYNDAADEYCQARYSNLPNTQGKGDYCRYQYCMAGLEAVIRM
jgi:hypothetical protein